MPQYEAGLALRQKRDQVRGRLRLPRREVGVGLQAPHERVLLQELNHRINNELASAIGAVSLAAARSGSDLVKVALSGVSDLLHHYAEVHQALQVPEKDARIDAAAHLRRLCLAISRSKLHHGMIKLIVAARPLRLQADQSWLLGMIVYELITNAARHAFGCGHGEIRVELLRAGAFVRCRVLDNGSAPAKVQPGRGLKIVHELAKGLHGRFEQQLGSQGSSSIVVFPSSGKPQLQQERLN